MISQNVFIVNYNSLYEILDEIKENLSFKIIKIENEEDFEKKLNLNRLDHLVISKTDHKLLLNNNITDKIFLDFNDLPLSFKKLLELIKKSEKSQNFLIKIFLEELNQFFLKDSLFYIKSLKHFNEDKLKVIFN